MSEQITIRTCKPFKAIIDGENCSRDCPKLQRASRNVYDTTCFHFGEKLKDWEMEPHRCQACIDAEKEADEQKALIAELVDAIDSSNESTGRK